MAAAQTEAPDTLELSCLPSCLLSKVTNFLDTKDLCVFDNAINNKQLRAGYLIGVANDSFLFRCEDGGEEDSAERHQMYVLWLLLRRVFLKSIVLTCNTNAATLLLYSTINRSHVGLQDLILRGAADFPKDLAVRNKKTLHSLVLSDQDALPAPGGSVVRRFQVLRVLQHIREWREAGGVLKRLKLECCEYGGEQVDVGCASLTHLDIENCTSDRYKTPGVSHGTTHLIWDIVSKCGVNMLEFTFECLPNGSDNFSMCDRNLGVLARFCPNLAHLHIVAVHKRTLTERGLIHLATRCAKLKHLQLLVKTQFTDASIAAVAGSLVSLTVLGLGKLKLQNPRTLRCLVHCCPQLEILHLQHCNATEAELIYLVTQAKKLKTLEIRQWGQLDFFRGDGYGTDFTLHEYSPQDLPLFGAEEPARVLTRQLEWLGRMAVHTQIEVDSAEKLEAASSHPDFKLVLLDNMSKWAGGVAEEDEEEEGEEEEGDEEVELDEDSEGEEG